MKKELKKNLRDMQSHPTTGEPHNRQVISTQVETIFMLDRVGDEISELNKTIVLNIEQSKKTEESNYRLNSMITLLTIVSTSIVVFDFSEKHLSEWVSSLLNLKIPTFSISIISMLIVDLFLIWIAREVENEFVSKKKM